MCASYISDDFTIEECFLQFAPISNLSSKSLAPTILNKFSQIGVDVSKMRGQGYDRAAAMSGKLKGALAHIRDVILLLYVYTVQRTASIWLSQIQRSLINSNLHGNNSFSDVMI